MIDTIEFCFKFKASFDNLASRELCTANIDCNARFFWSRTFWVAKSKDRWRPSIAIRYLDDLPGIDVGMYIGFKRSLMVHSPLGSHILPLVSQPAAQLTTSTPTDMLPIIQPFFCKFDRPAARGHLLSFLFIPYVHTTLLPCYLGYLYFSRVVSSNTRLVFIYKIS